MSVPQLSCGREEGLATGFTSHTRVCPACGDECPGGEGAAEGMWKLLGVQGRRGLTTTRRETEGTSGCTAGRQTWRAQGIHRSPGGKSGVRRGHNLGRARGEECGLEPEEWQQGKGVRKEPAEKHREARQEPLESGQKSRQEKAAVLWI